MYKHLETFAVGGLQNIGYAPDSDNLIVLSIQGRGIFDCLAGVRIFRDAEDWWADFDEKTGLMKGFGNEAGKTIETVGLFDNGIQMLEETVDGYKLALTPPEPDLPPFERFRVQSIYISGPDQPKTFVTKDGACEFRAYGFSPTGKSFVVASSCDLVIWRKL